MLLVALFISPALLCMKSSFEPHELKFFEEHFSKENLKKYHLPNEIQIFNNLSQQDMTNAVMITLSKKTSTLAYKLIMFWQDKIDINLPRTALSPSFLAEWRFTLLHEIIDLYIYYLTTHKHSDSQNKYKIFYLQMVNAFKHTINPNIIDQSDQLSIIKRILLPPVLAISKKHTKLKQFLKEFLEEFHDQIKSEIVDDALKVCVIEEHDSAQRVVNKHDCIIILQSYSYFPKKLSFTKERLEKTYNCYFRFKDVDK